jgi:hypothetical protein
VNEQPTRNQAALPREGGWLPAPAVAKLRELTTRYLDGDRDIDADVAEVARSFASATLEANLPPERLLIAMRALWREFGFNQSDRLQLASLYDRLTRDAIDSYYQH